MFPEARGVGVEPSVTRFDFRLAYDETLMEPKGSMYPMLGYLGFRVLVIIVQVLGKYMIIRYLDPKGYSYWDFELAGFG